MLSNDFMAALRMVQEKEFHKVSSLDRNYQGLILSLQEHMKELDKNNPVEYEEYYEYMCTMFTDTYSFGTVGAAFVACSQMTDEETGICIGCTPLCANSLPLPRETLTQNSRCVHNIAVIEHGKTRLIKKTDSDKILIFSTDRQHVFDGLHANDIDQLIPYGDIVDVYKRKGNIYEQILKDEKLSSLQLPYNNRWWLWWFFLFILLIIMVALFFSRRRN